jgi:potassium-dependent mechanosensitive channel
MSGLLPVLMSWGSLLLRGAVIAQLLVVITPLIGAPALARRWRWLRRQGQQRSRQLALLVSGTGIGLLASFSQPVGLALLVLAFNLGWQLLHLLERRLRPWLDGRRQQQMFSRILRPTYLVICTLILIDQLTDLRSLALLPLGVLFAQEISLGELALAIALLYGLMVGAGPLGRSLSQLLQRAMGFDEGSRRATALLSRYLIVFLGLLLLLNRLGFNRNALLAVAGGAVDRRGLRHPGGDRQFDQRCLATFRRVGSPRRNPVPRWFPLRSAEFGFAGHGVVARQRQRGNCHPQSDLLHLTSHHLLSDPDRHRAATAQ